MAGGYRGILFDLFGTLVQIDAGRLPVITIDGQEVRTTIGGLRELLAELVPETSLPTFAQALRTVSEEMAQARATSHVELPSRERFRRTLVRIGCPEDHLEEAAVHLSRAHLAVIAGATVFPPRHAALLASLRGRYRLGVVSNFDDTAAAYHILVRHGIAASVETVVISEALGVRKPHPVLVRAGLRGIDLPAEAALFVGDTFAEDVLAARAAGMDAAWIDAASQGVPAAAVPPRFVLTTLPDLAAVL